MPIHRNTRMKLTFLKQMVLIGIVIMALSACASKGHFKKLTETLHQYEAAVRWSGARSALAFIAPDNQPNERDLSFILKRFNQVKINGYQIVNQQPGSNDLEYIQLVELMVENVHTRQVRVVSDQQRWKYDQELKRWWLTSGVPDLSRQ